MFSAFSMFAKKEIFMNIFPIFYVSHFDPYAIAIGGRTEIHDEILQLSLSSRPDNRQI